MSSKFKVGMHQSMELICDCCRQPYYPDKSWEDQMNALVLGQERFAVCPVCTQSVTESTFNDPAYRQRCLKHVKRLYKLYLKSRGEHKDG